VIPLAPILAAALAAGGPPRTETPDGGPPPKPGDPDLEVIENLELLEHLELLDHLELLEPRKARGQDGGADPPVPDKAPSR